MKDHEDFVVLNNGIKMPVLGLGTYNTQDANKLSEAIRGAALAGYRHIDTASFYENEEVISKAIRESNIPREDLFLADKVWNTQQGYEKTLQAFNTSIKKLQVDYLDLYLIHWPQRMSKETWKAMEKLYKEGYVRAIGVSNFTVDFLKGLIVEAEIIPAINQIEFHPRFVQEELISFCRKQSIQLEAWSPLMRGRVFELSLLKELAQKYQRTVSQIVLRWDLQMGIVTIPKSTTLARIKENAAIFDFEISQEDMLRIRELNDGTRVGTDPHKVYEHPEVIID